MFRSHTLKSSTRVQEQVKTFGERNSDVTQEENRNSIGIVITYETIHNLITSGKL